MNQYQPQPNAAVNTTQNRIKFNDIPPRLTALVKGTVAYSHIRSLISGEALAKKIAEAKARSNRAKPKEVPHFSITLNNPSILVQDPTAPNMLEVAISQRFYTTKNGVHSVGFDIAGRYCWPIAVKDPATGQYNEIEPEGELAQGLEIILVMNSYSSSHGNGVGVNKVLVPGEIKYYRSNPDDMGDLTLQAPPIQQYQQPMNQYATQGTAYGQMQPAPVYAQPPQQAPVYNQTQMQQYQQPVNQTPVYMQPPVEADIPTIQAQPSQAQTVAQPGITVEQNLEPVGGFDPYAAYDPNGMM